MHTPDCDDPLEWWPEASPVDVDVAGLPVPNAITNPTRIPGKGKWLGFWGVSFSGFRIGITAANKSYPVINGLAVPYPKDPESGIDLYLSRDTGGIGIVSIARFQTREAAQAWGGSPTPGTGPGGSSNTSLPNRSLATRDTVAGGVCGMAWTQPGFMFATLHALPGNAGNITLDGAFVLQPGDTLNNHVDSATGWTGTGTNGDIIDIIEYGRV